VKTEFTPAEFDEIGGNGARPHRASNAEAVLSSSRRNGRPTPKPDRKAALSGGANSSTRAGEYYGRQLAIPPRSREKNDRQFPKPATTPEGRLGARSGLVDYLVGERPRCSPSSPYRPGGT